MSCAVIVLPLSSQGYCLQVTLLSPVQNRPPLPKIDISCRQIVSQFVTALVIVVIDELATAIFKLTQQVLFFLS